MAVLIVIGALVYAGTQNSKSSSPATVVPATAPKGAPRPVAGIQCGTLEQLAYHIHQHLTLYDNGKNIPMPTEIGIPGGEGSAACFYWIHTHTSTAGIIHVESPIKKTFTLGNFLDVWKATSGGTVPPGNAYINKLQTSPGSVSAFYNGHLWTKGFRRIPLTAHAVITLEVGKPVVPPRPFSNWNGQ
ncbi:MAG: hypothetical protein NVSMB52_00280 [Chloroflexota bacterium]